MALIGIGGIFDRLRMPLERIPQTVSYPSWYDGSLGRWPACLNPIVTHRHQVVTRPRGEEAMISYFSFPCSTPARMAD
jgi:hypothetical protein